MPRQKRHPTTPENQSISDIETPTVDERETMVARLTALYDRVNRHHEQERRERLLQWTKWAP